MIDPTARIALVTGGAKRVGRAIVEKLAAEGFDVAFTYLTSQSDAAALEHDLKSQGRRAMAIQADLTQADVAPGQIFDAFSQEFDRLDLLVNNASLYLPARLRETTIDLLRKVAAIHVQSPLLLCQKFESMLRTSGGHVVNMCDLLAERPWPEFLAYSASKGALVTLTLGLARELAPEVTVNGISPGVVDWPVDYPETEKEKYLKRIPLHRAGTPADVANLVHFLCTDSASYITGQIIRLDGGRSVT